MPGSDPILREGRAADLPAAFALSERVSHAMAAEQGIESLEGEPTDNRVASEWGRQRTLVEFMAAQDDARFFVCDGADGPIAFARAVRFGGVDELTDLVVEPGQRGRGVARALMERCWPGDPTPELGRLAVAPGAARDLSLYMDFGVMPVTGHWRLRQPTAAYLEARSGELEASEGAGVHVLEATHAVAEWKRLEPAAIGHARPLLHEHFGRDRACLALLDNSSERASALCWISGDGEIGPAVGAWPKDLVPVVIAALDRVAKAHEPEILSIASTTISWWLLRRLRGLGFRVQWPGWILCSEPLPGLDRYAPTNPPRLL